MQIRTRKFGDVVALDLRGKITIDAGVSLYKSIAAVLTEGSRKFVLNLEDTSVIDSSGLGELVAAYAIVTSKGGKLLLSHPFPRVLDLLAVTQVLTVFEILPSVIDAVAVFQSRDDVRALFVATCPACQQTGSKEFSLWDFFDARECFSCGAWFCMVKPADALVDVIERTTARLWSMGLQTYQEEHVHMLAEHGWTIDVPRRLDLFSFEVLAKAWYLIPGPRRIVLDVSGVEEFTERAVARLLDLGDEALGPDRSIYITQLLEGKPPSPIAASLVHTRRAYDVAAQIRQNVNKRSWAGTAAVIPVVITRVPAT